MALLKEKLLLSTGNTLKRCHQLWLLCHTTTLISQYWSEEMKTSTAFIFDWNSFWLYYIGWLLFLWILIFLINSCVWIIIFHVGQALDFSFNYMFNLINTSHGWSSYICDFSKFHNWSLTSYIYGEDHMNWLLQR